MIVRHNMQAANTNRVLGQNVKAVAKSTEKLSSGYQVNRAADDAAGLSISEKMRNQIRGLNQAVKNAEDGISLIQTAEGNMNEIHSILQRMGELAIKARNDINASEDRKTIDDEIQQLKQEICSITKKAAFNGTQLLDGSMASGKKLQVGANAGQILKITISGTSLKKLGLASVKVTAAKGTTNVGKNASIAISKIQSAIKHVSAQRSLLGAIQNRLEYTINNLENYSENLTSAESSIRDTDMATEMVNYSKNNILQQAAQSMLTQANQSTQGVLNLLQ
ncbi:MAG: flagellin [Clostridiales bacterium]|nr:flagellin [Clostridiales bacterium]